MPEISLVVNHEAGLHARPAALFVQTASTFESNVAVTYHNRTVNAKSILDVLLLGAQRGASITISADGKDADQAIKALKDLIESDFAAAS
jgi:phosphocarrier protein HPr